MKIQENDKLHHDLPAGSFYCPTTIAGFRTFQAVIMGILGVSICNSRSP